MLKCPAFFMRKHPTPLTFPGESANIMPTMSRTISRISEAIECYKKALQIDPKPQRARENLDPALAQKQAGK